MKILVVDNHDSFTYNLANILRKNKQLSFDVQKSNAIRIEKVKAFDKILFSPGPDVPYSGDIMWQIIQHYQHEKSILGICLGFQAVGVYYGAQLINLNTVFHGKSISINITGNDPLFAGIPHPFSAGLYHSWGISADGFPDNLHVTATAEDGRIMALAHRRYDVRGVQFHPESVMTPEGGQMIGNWLRI
jgi:anthranilate synthase component II